MHRLAITADQIMPFGQRLPILTEHISTGRWKPRIIVDCLACQPDAIRHMHPALAIIGAAAAIQIEQFASDVGGIDAAGILILHLVQAAFAAAIAKRFPFIPGKRFDWPFPEGGIAQLSAPIW